MGIGESPMTAPVVSPSVVAKGYSFFAILPSYFQKGGESQRDRPGCSIQGLGDRAEDAPMSHRLARQGGCEDKGFCRFWGIKFVVRGLEAKAQQAKVKRVRECINSK